jgi:hypothetical protein
MLDIPTIDMVVQATLPKRSQNEGLTAVIGRSSHMRGGIWVTRTRHGSPRSGERMQTHGLAFCTMEMLVR